jgi:hypothetical protein
MLVRNPIASAWRIPLFAPWILHDFVPLEIFVSAPVDRRAKLVQVCYEILQPSRQELRDWQATMHG